MFPIREFDIDSGAPFLSKDADVLLRPCFLIVQARMGSERLPGKSLKLIKDKPLLYYVLSRIQNVHLADGIIVATTSNSIDDPICKLCQEMNIQYFRGSEDNVLDRYVKAASEFHVSTIVRITADNPCIDPKIIDKAIFLFNTHINELDYLSNTINRTFPRGLDLEIITKHALNKAFRHATEKNEKEHVTLYIAQHPKVFRLGNITQKNDYSKFRITVDTEQDFLLAKAIIEHFYPDNPNYTESELIAFLQKHPEITALNAQILQKSIEDRV